MEKINIGGMMCVHCKARVEKALLAVEGVREVRVDLQQQLAEIDGTADRDALCDAVAAAGYSVTR